jgi:hypothetical protein
MYISFLFSPRAPPASIRRREFITLLSKKTGVLNAADRLENPEAVHSVPQKSKH